MNEKSTSLTSWRCWLPSINVTSAQIYWPTWGANTRSPPNPALWFSMLWENQTYLIFWYLSIIWHSALCVLMVPKGNSFFFFKKQTSSTLLLQGCWCTCWDCAGGYFASIPGWDLETSPPTGHQQFYSRESWFQTGTNRNPSAAWPTSGSTTETRSSICTLCVSLCVCVVGCDFECSRYLKVVGGVRQSWCFLAVISAPPYESIVS